MNLFPLRRLALLAIVLILLAACAQPPADTTPGLRLNATYTPEPTATDPATPTPLGTEDPSEGLTFDVLTLERSGGLTNETRTWTVLGNGALLINGNLLGSIAQEVVLDLDLQLDQMGFFRLETHYGPDQPRPDTYAYALTVVRGGSEGTITTVDGSVPPSIRRLIDQLMALTPTGLPPEPTVDPFGPPPA
jgi:hypothetical protein